MAAVSAVLLHSTACTAGMILAAAATMLSAAPCGQNNGNTTHRNPEGLISSVEYADLKKGEDILISEWVGEPEFIALDSRPEAITNGRQFAVSDNYRGPREPRQRQDFQFSVHTS